MKLPEIAGQLPFVVIDVGAAEGFQNKWAAFGRHLRVIGFEPDLRTFQMLEKSDERIRYLNVALGKDEEERTLYLTEKATCSSTFPPNFTFLQNFPGVERYRLVGEEKLRVRSMDRSLLSEFGKISGADFVKLDVHGVEVDIIDGAKEVISQGLIGLEIECCFQELWSGQDLFSDIASALQQEGFDLFDIRPFYWRRNANVTGQRKGQMIYGDALFLRSPEGMRDFVAVMSDKAKARGKTFNAILAYLAFGYIDCAEALLDYCGDLFTLDDQQQIKSALRPSLKDRILTFLLRRGKLHRVARSLAELTDAGGRQFVTSSAALGNYDDRR